MKFDQIVEPGFRFNNVRNAPRLEKALFGHL
jgi:hypothetical protein